MNKNRSPIAITMGDPSGIGPEIIIKALSKDTTKYPFVVLGDPKVMAHAVNKYGTHLTSREINHIDEAEFQKGFVEVLSTSSLGELPEVGKVSAACGHAAFDAIVTAIQLAKDKKVSGIVTAPIHKEAFAAAGIKYPGHTEILQDYSGSDKVAMMLANDVLRVVLVTIHCSLKEAIERADFPAQIETMKLAYDGARALGIENPRIAVAGLNPHAGEGGLFGDEEINIIMPAIQVAKEDGLNVSGPWPGDTVFMQARQGKFDIVVAQYHDQGLIPVKYLGLEKGVNVTLGLPFIRTSPDHGTAFDIAGKGVADPASLETALDYAIQLSVAKQKDKI